MIYEVKGTIKHLSQVEKVGQNSQPKQTVVLSTVNGQYEDLYPLEAFGSDRVHSIRNFRVGQVVDARFAVRGREWDGKYYANLALVDLKLPASGQPSAQPATQQTELPPEQTQSYDDSGLDEDIPF